jgi:alginate O-acetyltransferase complex protein AlgI
MMTILSAQFLAFSAACALLLWVCPGREKTVRVLICNAVFLYLIGSWSAVAYVLGLTVYIWAAAAAVQKRPRRMLFIILTALPVLGLCFFKYGGYFLPGGNLLMPLGISFYTFKALSYLADVHRQKLKARRFIPVFDYIAFFPAFIAGPIHRAKPFFEELKKPFIFSYADQKNGAVQAFFGVFEKLVIADELALLVPKFLDNTALSGVYTTLGVFLYSFQIYTDFDAYSNITIGIARLLGFHLERNFYTPYLASSLREFWRRWHISLSSWLQDYIYIPLGGSRCGRGRQILNLMIVFAVSGLWHGSTPLFLIWGLGHGLISALEVLRNRGGEGAAVTAGKKLAGLLLNFLLVSLLWVFFRSADLAQALAVFARMAAGTGLKLDCAAAGIPQNEFVWMFVLIGIVIATDLMRSQRNMLDWLSRQNFALRWAIYLAAMVIAMIFGVYGPGYNAVDFIYVTF